MRGAKMNTCSVKPRTNFSSRGTTYARYICRVPHVAAIVVILSPIRFEIRRTRFRVKSLTS